MKIDLLDFVDSNKSINNLREEAGFRQELNNLIAAIIRGEEDYYTSNDKLIENLGLKAKPIQDILDKRFGTGVCIYRNPEQYKIVLNKANIKRVQKFIDNERYEHEDEY